jgi:cytochrome c oxidase subunit 2
MIRRRAMILVGLLSIASNAFAGGDPEAGKTFFAICQACHGPDAQGNQQLGAPRLAGQKPWYLLRQLRHFRAGARGVDPRDTFGLQMRAMSITLPDDQAVQDVVAYIATFDAKPTPATITGDLENGEKQFALCAACHGSRAEGMEPYNTPRLEGQHDWYMIRQLQNFRADIRGRHDIDIYGRQMAAMARLLSEQDVTDVVAYIDTLSREP